MLQTNQLAGFGAYEEGGCSCTPAYATGDRTSSITVTSNLTITGTINNLVDGAFDDDSSDSFWWTGAAAVAGLYIRFQFASKTLITEAKWYMSGANPHGVWKWQGSDNGSDWTDIGSSFTLGNATPFQTQTQLNGNTVGYLYYQLLGVSGNASTTPYNREIEFEQCTC